MRDGKVRFTIIVTIVFAIMLFFVIRETISDEKEAKKIEYQN